ncbi:MAG: Sir2 family NAD-dependent protein deacetylase [Bacillota bacterium]|uniref:Sir2 family NAD-dependent protein deacetylase n=1 Tax=Desulfurispora thermophila TaxID=265470 RepID=UPI00037FAE03|nr:Sir2 family NAD-dependent protein deacetylase [Desulfurispora thermophila]
MPWREKIPELADLLLASSKTLVLTGAGISTESGIPDFRGPDGLWSKVDPIEVFSVETFTQRPKVFYEVGLPLLGALHQARPNIAHYVLARLEDAGLIHGVITQNVDGLHQQAGSRTVYEMHGHLRSATCIGCGHQVSWRQLEEMVEQGDLPPLCAACGGVYKPDAVFFGDPMPPEFDYCCREVADCQLLLVIGSSLEVAPVNYLPYLSKKFAIINMGPTMADSRAVLRLEARAGEVMQALADELTKRGKLKS